MWKSLSEMSHVRLYGPSPAQPRTPTIGFTVRGSRAEDVSRALAEEGLFVSHGDFYAMTCIERLGVEALVRVGCACYTTDDEIERLIAGVAALA
jgi:selenocysteine lyase/cysteine desulfurase